MPEKSKYCYDNGVLINKREIKDLSLLHKYERNVTAYRISMLETGIKIIDNFFDPNEYLKVHYYLFSDVYPFAGEIRDEAIYKSNEPYMKGKTPFCYPSFIYGQLKYNLTEMKNKVRYIKSREDLLKYLAYYYSEINVIHPFREGNGRTLRIFLKLYVEFLNKYLKFDDVEIKYSLWSEEDREELLKATIIATATGNIDLIIDSFDKVLVYKEERHKVR